MEHTGVIEEAGFKPKKPPKTGQNFCMKVSGWDKTYYINREEDKPLQVLAVSLMGKTAKVTYEQNGEYRNVSAIEQVADALSIPVSPNGETMTKEDWGLKDRRITRVAIAKSIIEAFGVAGSSGPNLRSTLGYADDWFNWVYELPQISATKPQEVSPPIATANKPAVIPPEQGVRTKGALLNDVLNFMKDYKWGTAKMRQEAMRLANEEGWQNGEEISADSYKAMDIGQLTHFVAFLKTEIAKVAK